jgi:hypothetical protein
MQLTEHEPQMVRAPPMECRWLAPSLMEQRVDGGDYELVDVMTSLFHHRGCHPRQRRVVEQLACCQQRGIDARYCW